MKQRLIVFSVLAIVTGAVHSTELAVCIDDLKVRHIAQVSAVVESEGYCRWTRVEEACQAHGLQEDRYRPLHQLRRRGPDDEPGQM